MKSCVNLLREVVNYQWEQPSASRISLNQPEKPLKKDDHAMDDLRYMISYAYDQGRPEPSKTEQELFIDSIVFETQPDNQDWSNI